MKECLWRWNGLLLGYPECCVENFVARATEIHASGHSNKGHDVFKGSGFLACDACAQLDPDVLKARINAARFPELPAFPHKGSMNAYLS